MERCMHACVRALCLFCMCFTFFLPFLYSHVLAERKSQCGCDTHFYYGETSGVHEMDSIRCEEKGS